LILLPVFVEDVASGDRAARPSIAPISDFAFMAHTPTMPRLAPLPRCYG